MLHRTLDAVGGEDAAVIFDMAEANQICVS